MPGLRGSAPRPAEYQTNGDGTKNGGEGVRANAFGRRLEFVVYLLSRIFGGCCHLIDSLGNRGRRLGAFNRCFSFDGFHLIAQIVSGEFFWHDIDPLS